MHELYARARLDIAAGQTAVMGAARHLWEKAESAADRVEVSALLLGRRVSDDEVRSLPADFRDHVFEGGEFGGMLAVASQIVEVEQ